MRALLLAALAACGFPEPTNIGDDQPPIDAVGPLPHATMMSFDIAQKYNESSNLPHLLTGAIGDHRIDLYEYGADAPFMFSPSFVPSSGHVEHAGTTVESNTGPYDFSTVQQFVVVDGSASTTYDVHLHRSAFTVNPAPFGVPVTAMAVADFDGDQYPDCVVALNPGVSGGPQLGMLRKAPQAGLLFSNETAIKLPIVATSMTAVTIEPGKLPGLAVASKSVTTPSVLPNTSTAGEIAFATAAPLNGIAATVGLAAADVNGDGVDELVRGNLAMGNVVFNPTTAAPPSTAVPVPTGSVMTLATAQLDDDLLPDLVLATGPNVYTFHNTSKANQSSFAHDPANTFSIAAATIASGDIDGDTRGDLLFATGLSSAMVTLVKPLVQGSMPQAIPVRNVGANVVVAAACLLDLDGDGHADPIAVWSDATGGHLSPFVSSSDTGATQFIAGDTVKFDATAIQGCAVADFDRDGRLDLVVLTGTGVVFFGLTP